MSGKIRMNTTKHIRRAKERAAREAKTEQRSGDTSFMYAHEAGMRAMLKGVDRDDNRFLD